MEKIALMYHCVYNESTAESGFQNDSALMYKVQQSKFEAQVAAIADYLDANKLPKETVEFTFDDGGVSFYFVIAPILEKYGFKGVFFVATSNIGKPLFMNEAEIKFLEERGHLVASHSDSHPSNISSLGYPDIVAEWEKSCDKLRDILGHEINTASVPNGDSSEDVVKACHEVGIRTLYTSEPTTKGKMQEGVTLIGRYVVLDSFTTDDVVRIIYDSGYRRTLRFKYGIIQCVHKILGKYYNVLKSALFKY